MSSKSLPPYKSDSSKSFSVLIPSEREEEESHLAENPTRSIEGLLLNQRALFRLELAL